MQKESPLLTTAEAQKYLGVKTTTFCSVCRDLPYVMVGKRKKYDIRDLEKFIQLNKKNPCELKTEKRLYTKGKIHRTGGTASQLKGDNLGEVLKQATEKLRYNS